MMAITIQQPWAWAIFNGKDVENRTQIGTWRRAVGERVAVHAGSRWSDRGALSPLVREAALAALVPYPDRKAQALVMGPRAAKGELPRGAVIGTVLVASVHWADDCWGAGEHCSPWAEGINMRTVDSKPVGHLVLVDPRACPPVPCSGQLGLWRLAEDVALELAAS